MDLEGSTDEATADWARGRIREILALLEVIDHAELFANLPADAVARAQHRLGASLLEIMRRELLAFASAFDHRR